MPWRGPFVIDSLSDKNTCVLKNGDKILKTKQHIKNIKKFYTHNKEDCDVDEICIVDNSAFTKKKKIH